MFGKHQQGLFAVLVPLIVAGLANTNVNSIDLSKSDGKLLSQYSWMTNEFFHDIIKHSHQNQTISILNFIGYNALKPGENFEVNVLNVTVYYRVDDHPEVRDLALIVNAGIADHPRKKMVDERFEKEIFVYKEIIPNAERLLMEIGDDTKLAARLLAADAQAPYIILENLASKGYRMLDRRVGFDVAHFDAVLSKLAKFHATTAVLRFKNHPCMINNFVNNAKPNEFVETDGGVRFALQSIKEMTRTIAGYEKISKKLEIIGDTLYAESQDIIYPTNETFNALIHTDIWVPNVMIADQQSATIDVLIQNFGGVRFGPIIYDLLYTFFTSSQADLGESDWDYLLQNYYYVLRATLLKLKYPADLIPSLTDIHVQCLKRGRGLVFRGIMDFTMNVYDDANMETADALFSDGEKYRKERLKMLTNSIAKKGLQTLMDYFDRKGFFD